MYLAPDGTEQCGDRRRKIHCDAKSAVHAVYRVLRAAAIFVEAHLLTFNFTGVAGDQTSSTYRATQGFVVLARGAVIGDLITANSAEIKLSLR